VYEDIAGNLEYVFLVFHFLRNQEYMREEGTVTTYSNMRCVIDRTAYSNGINGSCGRAMAQAVSRRPPTAEARVRSRVSSCGVCGGQSGTGTGFSPSKSVFPCQFHSTGAPLLVKMKKKTSSFSSSS
jgi:hypothetical protein